MQSISARRAIWLPGVLTGGLTSTRVPMAAERHDCRLEFEERMSGDAEGCLQRPLLDLNA